MKKEDIIDCLTSVDSLARFYGQKRLKEYGQEAIIRLGAAFQRGDRLDYNKCIKILLNETA